MNHTSNRDQNLQNTTSSAVGVIDLTKENPSNATTAYCSISLPKKRETTIESADIRPQKRIRKEPIQERNLFHPSISNILNQLPLHGTQKIIDSRISPTLYLNNTIIPTSSANFTSSQISNGRQTIVMPSSTTILSSPSSYSQYVSQNYNNIDHLEPYNIGLMKSVISQIPPQQPVQPVVPISSSNSTASSNNASQEIIDLTTDSDDNDCIIDEKETNRNLCWGMINTEFLVLYPRPCPGEKGPEKVELERCTTKGQVQIRVTKDNISFGVIDQELAIVLNPLIDEKLIWMMEAKIPENSLHSDMRLPLHLVLYGRPCHTNIVSKHLADRGVILKDTEDYNRETRFLNPHNLSPGNTYLNRNIQKVYKGYSGGSIGTTTKSSEEIKNKMNKVFNSLMTAENIPELEPDPLLITPLYKHQKQALYFLTKKEQYNDFTNDQTNELMSLWRTRTSAGRHTSYYNVVTNEEVTKKPAQMRGGIIADDMGLGKTIQMIALILGSKNEAIEFAKESTISSSSSLNPSDSINSSSSILNKSLSSNESSNKNLRSRGTLIICPLSTVSNWEEQFASHASEGALSIYVYHGGARISDPSHLINYDVVITTYNVTGTEYSKQSKPKNQQSKKNTVDSGESAASSPANRPINFSFNSPVSSPANSPAPTPSIPSALQQIHWFRIILDEAHIIKDDKTIQSMAACSLEAERRWCLTGTPIQNKVEDLFALIKFLHMDPFSIKEKWRKYILHPIKSINPDGISRLQTLMKCITLRRTKTINGKPLLSLPPRNDHIRYLDLNEYELKLYKKLRHSQAERMKLYERENNMMQHYVNILQSLLRLRQICAHYSLVKESDMPEDLEQEIVNEGLTPARALMLLSIIKDNGIDQCGSCIQELVGNVVVTRCEHLFCMECANKHMSKLLVSTNVTTSSDDKKVSENCPICGLKLFLGDICEVNDSKDFENDHITRPEGEKKAHSTKVRALIEDLVQAKEDGVKSVVFSQWTKMLDLIEDALNEYDIKFTRLDGTMSRAERTQNMNTFKRQEDVNVILVSLKAGGVGLNLTAAQRAYLMDPFWNPSVENQAIDRIHRLGQTCPVDTIRFIIRGSVEENILELQKHKLRLAELTLSEKLSKQDMIRHRLEDLKILFK